MTLQSQNSSAYVTLSLEISPYTISTLGFNVKNYGTTSECSPTWRVVAIPMWNPVHNGRGKSATARVCSSVQKQMKYMRQHWCTCSQKEHSANTSITWHLWPSWKNISMQHKQLLQHRCLHTF